MPVVRIEIIINNGRSREGVVASTTVPDVLWLERGVCVVAFTRAIVLDWVSMPPVFEEDLLFVGRVVGGVLRRDEVAQDEVWPAGRAFEPAYEKEAKGQGLVMGKENTDKQKENEAYCCSHSYSAICRS